MQRARVIAVLLMENGGLLKTQKFKPSEYVGDPINAVRIFNEKRCDELILLDIGASKTGAAPDFELIADIGSECFMPFSYGGGVTSVDHAMRLVAAGVEKVVLNSTALANPSLISSIAKKVGSSSTVVSIDVGKTLFGEYKVFSHVSGKNTSMSFLEWLKRVEGEGAGEVMVTSVDREGTLKGPDLALAELASKTVNVPIVYQGGVRSIVDCKSVLNVRASGVAAGAWVTLHGRHRAVLISYPPDEEIKSLSF